MSEYTRKTITVPAELSRKMSGVEGVNWSKIASKAFESELNRLETAANEKVMLGVIERLRKSRHQANGSPFEKGREAGIRWASDFAEFGELERIAGLNPHGPESYLAEQWDNKPRAVQLMFWVLGSGHPFNSPGASELPRSALKKLQDDHPTSWDVIRKTMFAHRGQRKLFDDRGFVRGLISGAQSVWEQVRDQV